MKDVKVGDIINVEVTDEEYDLLQSIAKSMEMQDNHGTALPLYCVKEKIKLECDLEEAYDFAFIDCMLEVKLSTVKDLLEFFIDEKESILDSYTISEDEYDEIIIDIEDDTNESTVADKIASYLGLEVVPWRWGEKYVGGAVFITAQGADDYIKMNKHKLEKPSVYITTARGNKQMTTIMDIIARMGNLEEAHR